MPSRRAMIAALAGLPLAARAAAASPEALTTARNLLANQGLYLPRYRAEKAALDRVQGDQLSLARQRFGQMQAMVGDEAGAFATWRRAGISPGRTAPDLAGVTAEDAVEAIARAAAGRRVVILNEAHYASRCRAFAADVAERLSRDGFTIFAAEDFGSGFTAGRLAAGAPLTTNLGSYLPDPQFADLVRRARAAGYRFAEYEQTYVQRTALGADPDPMARRDEAEAANLVANVLDKDPSVRVLVYCGFDHAAKVPIGPNTWMAARLKRKTGLDPLCIDQSEGLPHADANDEDAAVAAVLERFAPTAPIVVRQPNGEALALGVFRGAVDLAVYHPRLPDHDGRPGWLAAGSRRRLQVRLPSGQGGERLLQAVAAADATVANPIPADQTLVAPGAAAAALFVAPGRYVVRLETEAGLTVLGERQFG